MAPVLQCTRPNPSTKKTHANFDEDGRMHPPDALGDHQESKWKHPLLGYCMYIIRFGFFPMKVKVL